MQAEHKIKVKQYDEWLEKEGKKKDSSSDARGDVKISLVELSSSHVFAGRLKVESVSRGYGLDSIQADDILMKLDGSDILGLRKGEVLNLFKVRHVLPISAFLFDQPSWMVAGQARLENQPPLLPGASQRLPETGCHCCAQGRVTRLASPAFSGGGRPC